MRLEEMPTLEGEIERLKQQLTECRADNKRLRDALKSAGHYAVYGDKFHAREVIEQALALPSDSTALDTLKKQWQREALLDVAVAVKEMGVFNYSVESIADEIHNRAKELE